MLYMHLHACSYGKEIRVSQDNLSPLMAKHGNRYLVMRISFLSRVSSIQTMFAKMFLTQ